MIFLKLAETEGTWALRTYSLPLNTWQSASGKGRLQLSWTAASNALALHPQIPQGVDSQRVKLHISLPACLALPPPQVICDSPDTGQRVSMTGCSVCVSWAGHRNRCGHHPPSRRDPLKTKGRRRENPGRCPPGDENSQSLLLHASPILRSCWPPALCALDPVVLPRLVPGNQYLPPTPAPLCDSGFSFFSPQLGSRIGTGSSGVRARKP